MAADFPDPEFERLLQAYFDGRLSPAERATLEQRLRDDPAARDAYWESAQWHAALSLWGEQNAGREAAKQVAFPEPPRRRAWLGWGIAAAMAAALVAGLAALRWFRPSPATSAAPLARISYQHDAALPGELHPGVYTLASGVVRFETRAGASVSVVAPAEFRLVAADRLELTRGRLTARMLHHGARLTVKVRDFEVTDLGTAFGVDASGAGRALVSVFDGLVAVKSAATAGELRLTRGESLVHAADQTVADAKTDYDTATFRELWPLTAGVNEASRLVEFLPPGPLLRPLREYHANDHVFLFPERQATPVDLPLLPDLDAKVRRWPDSPVSPFPLAHGTKVSSYLLFFQPDASARGEVRHLTGDITFQHPVVGVLCSDQGLDASDGPFGVREADYSTPGQRRGLEEADKENYRGGKLPHDSIVIGPDGRTVHFDFYVSDEREQMRVLVSAP